MDLCALHGRLLHGVDLFRQRRPRVLGRRVVPSDLSRSDAGDDAFVVRAAQDDPHREELPDHVDRGLHLQPLWQEPTAGRARDDHRGRRHGAVHRIAAEGDLDRLCGSHRTTRCGLCARRREELAGRQHALYRADACAVHGAVRSAAPGCGRAPRRHGRRDRLRVRGQAGRLPCCWRLRDLWHLQRIRRHLLPCLRRPRSRASIEPQIGKERRLRRLVCADSPRDAVGDLPAAPVPGRRCRKRQ
jgi:hypothetical protein